MKFKAKTCVRYNDPWHAHVLTFSCHNRQPLLNSDISAGIFIESLKKASLRHHFDLWAYVVMPEHVHLLIWPRLEDYSISKILSAIKRPAAYHAGKAGIGFEAHFWQPGGGYDRNLRKDRTVHKEIDYIHANPVRRGLRGNPEDWKYSSAAYWAGHENVPLEMDRTVPPK